jgi:hypothetical protein
MIKILINNKIVEVSDEIYKQIVQLEEDRKDFTRHDNAEKLKERNMLLSKLVMTTSIMEVHGVFDLIKFGKLYRAASNNQTPRRLVIVTVTEGGANEYELTNSSHMSDNERALFDSMEIGDSMECLNEFNIYNSMAFMCKK